MAKRSIMSLEFTPNYGWMREPTLVTIKLYYNGSMDSNRKRKTYKGKSTEYFDFVDMDKIGLIELWGYAEQVGCVEKDNFRFWHKIGKSLNNGRYLENDADVVQIRNHVPKNFEVEIYIEHDKFVSINEIDASGVLEKPKKWNRKQGLESLMKMRQNFMIVSLISMKMIILGEKGEI
ncbi:uncharacterized protein [Primulina eburnea]|uniref:uncharacterized protein n=1 Tax=Primulina eburnea TaxID=1245227 RepID=UPI003C6C2F6A